MGVSGLVGGFVKGAKDAGAFVGGDAGAVVGDFDNELPASAAGRDFDFGRVRVGGVFGGIVDEVEENVLESGEVGMELQFGSGVDDKLESSGGEAGGEAFVLGLQKGVDAGGGKAGAGRTAFDTGEGEDIFD